MNADQFCTSPPRGSSLRGLALMLGACITLPSCAPRQGDAAITSSPPGVGQPVAWFEVLGTDGKHLRSFYSDLFGWKTNDVAPGANYGVSDAPAHGIGGGIGASPNAPGDHVTFFVEVPDVAAALRDVERLGGKTISPPRTFPDMRLSAVGRGASVTFAYFADPEGHVVGICKGVVRP
jgi:predicted enzyme related to lactoylglutathione lyase